MSNLKNIVPFLLIIALLGTIVYAVTNPFSFDNNGSVGSAIAVTAYTDNGQDTEVTLLEWGGLAPGDVVTHIIYVNSTSNIPVALNLTTTDWTPPTSLDYISITWDLEGAVIDPLEFLEATLTLTVDPTAPPFPSFSFTAHITAEEAP